MQKKIRNHGFTLIELPVVRKRGFTLIELLIVIAIIAILATIVVVSYLGAQIKSRDNKRKADLQTIASAYQIYYQENKSWNIPGTGYLGGGQGGFNIENDSYPKSMAHGLEESGYLNPAPRDPLQTSDNDTTHGFYMKYYGPCTNNIGSTVWARLESPSSQYITDAGTGCNAYGSNGCIDRYLMNFAVNIK